MAAARGDDRRRRGRRRRRADAARPRRRRRRGAPLSRVRVATLNLASGRSGPGHLPADRLAAALTGLDVDVLAVQEVDVAQDRSHGVDQAAVAAAALGAAHWRFAPTLAGTPGPLRGWHRVLPDADLPAGRPGYGIAVLSRLPVRRWRVEHLGHGRGRLPVRAPDPRTGEPRTWWVPDEPRTALAAVLDELTVVSAHLSFSPATAVRQLARLRRWCATLPGPVVVAGDLNLPGPVVERVLRGRRLATGASYPAHDPRVQLDHLVGPVGGSASLPGAGGPEALRVSGTVVRRLDVGDHRLVAATLDLPGGGVR